MVKGGEWTENRKILDITTCLSYYISVVLSAACYDPQSDFAAKAAKVEDAS